MVRSFELSLSRCWRYEHFEGRGFCVVRRVDDDRWNQRRAVDASTADELGDGRNFVFGRGQKPTVAAGGVAAAEVDQRRGRRALAGVDDAAEDDDVVPAFDHPLEPAANGRERVENVWRAFVCRVGIERRLAEPRDCLVTGEVA